MPSGRVHSPHFSVQTIQWGLQKTGLYDRWAILHETDGENANYDTDPYPVVIEQKDVTSDMALNIPQGRSGGCAIKLAKLSK